MDWIIGKKVCKLPRKHKATTKYDLMLVKKKIKTVWQKINQVSVDSNEGVSREPNVSSKHVPVLSIPDEADINQQSSKCPGQQLGQSLSYEKRLTEKEKLLLI